MTHGSLFSGIGGFDLAAEWAGWDNIFHCEWNPFGQKVLKHHFPKSITYEDITKTDFSIHRGNIDIISGGFPCQPYSTAGKRLGKEDDRHLWPEMLRAIREVQPSWVVGENVRGLTNWNGGVVFDEVQADLEAEGYEVTPFLLPACAVNAPHKRDRIWFVAFNSKSSRSTSIGKVFEGNVANTCGSRLETNNTMRESTQEEYIARMDSAKLPTHPNSNGQQWRNSEYEINPSEGGEYALGNTQQMGEYATNTTGIRLEGQRRAIRELEGGGGFSSTMPRNMPNTSWQNFPSQSPICRGDDGLPKELDNITFSKWRNESIKAYGNAIVPQVAYQIFKAINQYEKLNHNT